MDAKTLAAAAPQSALPEVGALRSVGLFLELAKARLAALVVVTAAAGFALASRGPSDPIAFVAVLLGTALTAFGANALNQVLEVDRDRRMERTRSRPLPSGQVGRGRATLWGVTSAVIGLAVLVAGTNLLTAGLALSVILLYLLAYTPLKVRTPLATAVGAVCGAIPPMMGWTAASGRLEPGAWVLFGVLFLWQMPHFLALAWLYRDDYARGGFRMLPSVDPTGAATGRLAMVHAVALLPVVAAAVLAGVSGRLFLAGSVVLTVAFATLAWEMLRHRTAPAARRLFLASLLYLPLVLGLMVADRDNRLLHRVAPVVAASTVAAPLPPG